MHTILGATGISGIELARHLPKYCEEIRIVSRNPRKINHTDHIFAADLLDVDQTRKAVEGSEVAYLTVGLPYNSKLWREKWPPLMKNVIDACSQTGAKLVFLDNIYPLGKVEGKMTEASPLKPASKKGEVRKEVDKLLLNAMEKGRLTGMIAKAADFYGPHAATSIFNRLALNNMIAGKKAQWIGRDDMVHSFTYTPDIGKAMALLGNTPSAFGQIWHLPTASPALTGKELIEIAAAKAGTEPKYSVLKKWMIQIAGLFNPEIREVPEMMYQNEYPYIFDSSKFEQAFDFTPTSYEQGIEETIKAYQTT